MRKKLLYFAILAAVGGGMMTSCSEDDLSSESVIISKQTKDTEFDKWLKAAFVDPYNIDFAYRYDDKESDLRYYIVPADYDQAVILAHIVKYTCVEAYDEVAGYTFTRTYFPKRFQLFGDWQFRNNGTYVLGTAEGGRKIYLYGVNYLASILAGETGQGSFEFDYGTDIIANLNHFYLKTIHHEFTHILNQTKDYSADYQQITGKDYLADDWSTDEGEEGYLERGFITPYSQHSHQEDFAEMLSEYVTNSAEQWDAWMEEAGDEGAGLLAQKLDIVRDYMNATFHIDIDKLRSSVLGREHDIATGKVNLTDLTVK